MLEVRDLKKYYKTKGGVEVHALDGVSIQFPETGMVFLLGKSGSGKSTLLNVSGGLDRPDSGEIIVKGKSSKDFTQSDFDSYRNTFVGFVFQEYNILNEFNIETNIALALELQGKKNDKKAVEDLLNKVDLEGMGKRKPNTLSGGQKQRIAIARALIKNPEIIMADEPTGALDSNTGKQVLDTLKKLSETKLVIIVSHDRDFAEEYADRIIELKDGKILSDHCKTFAKAQEISSNIRKVGDGTIQIKDGSNLSESELKEVLNSIKGKGEIIISNNENNVTAFKKIAKISDDGAQQYFKDTDLKKIDIKSYDGSKTKFIKSKLPARHALKMGASNLKIKPGRLVFTIFLSVIAFSMFGVLSTFMLYNPSYSQSKGLMSEPYKSLLLQKEYKALRQNVRTDSNGKEEYRDADETFYSTNISKNDIEELNKNSLGMDFAGVYKVNIPFESYLQNPSKDKPYYSIGSLYGLSDCGEEYLLRQQNFQKLAGSYPTENNEIAVSEYIYNVFKECGYKNPSNDTTKAINDVNDLIGCKISASLSSQNSGSKLFDFTIVGVYRTEDALEDSKFNNLKKQNDNTLSEEDYRKLKSNFEDVYNSSYSGLGFISPGFYNSNKKYLKGENYYNNSIYLNSSQFYGLKYLDMDNYRRFHKEEDKTNYYPDESYSFAGFTIKEVQDNNQYFTFYDVDGNKINDCSSISMNEVFVNLGGYSIGNLLQSMSNYTTGQRFGRYDRNGELSYYNPIWDYYSTQLYINYDNIKLSFEDGPGYEEANNEVIVGDNGEILLFRYFGYANSSYTDVQFEQGGDYQNYVDGWFDKDKNFVGSSIEEYDLTSFYYDATNKKPYLANDIEKLDGNIVLKNDHNVILENDEYSTYILNADGSISRDGNGDIRKGLFVNTTTGELSFNKTSGSVFTDKYYKDTNNKIYIGKNVSSYGVYAHTAKDSSEIQYSFNNYFCDLGYVNMESSLPKNDRFIDTKPGLLEAFVKIAAYLKQSYIIDNLKYVDEYSDIDFDQIVDLPLTDNDVKLLLEGLKEFATVCTDEWTQVYSDKVSITTKTQIEYVLDIKGFFILTSDVNSNADVILNNGWTDRIDNPYGDSYTWREVITTKYKVDSSAQYHCAISLCDKTTDQINFFASVKDDDSFYIALNNTYMQIYGLTKTLKTMKTVFLIVGLVMAAFSALMLLNFISTSISAKQKEIGILRAVGARGSDVFKIYFSEAGIVCLICFFLSAIAGGVVCFFLNREMLDNLTIELFDYSLINIAIIFGVALIVGIFGTLFPVIKASRRPPVESIRAL